MDRSELSDRDRIAVAVVDDRVVGVQPVTVDRSFYVEPLEQTIDFDGAYFWGLYVAPEWRRRGVATALVARALSFVANETSRTCVQTLVGIDNDPSKRVLTGVGFERKRTRSYYRAFGFQRRGQS
jgi:GNAT superfamily N-acetyltransferase